MGIEAAALTASEADAEPAATRSRAAVVLRDARLRGGLAGDRRRARRHCHGAGRAACRNGGRCARRTARRRSERGAAGDGLCEGRGRGWWLTRGKPVPATVTDDRRTAMFSSARLRVAGIAVGEEPAARSHARPARAGVPGGGSSGKKEGGDCDERARSEPTRACQRRAVDPRHAVAVPQLGHGWQGRRAPRPRLDPGACRQDSADRWACAAGLRFPSHPPGASTSPPSFP